MKFLKVFSLALCLGIVLAGCNNLQKGAGIGAAGGAVLGGIIGNIAGNTIVGAAIGGAVGAGTGALIGKHMDKVKAEAEQVRNAEVQEITDANGLDAVKVTFDSGILFATGKADLTAASKTSLSQLAGVLKKNADCDVAIQGHTDNVGFRGKSAAQSVELNKALSLDRAAAVSSYLQSLGVSTSQIKEVQGLGQESPVASNDTEAGRAQNRRVEVYLYASQEMINAAEAGTLQ
jgi:outer membrane protein OmpA-like peptidoglycan-associated protein